MSKAWNRALYRFEEAYGDHPRLDDEHDRAAFMPLLEEELRAELHADRVRLVERFGAILRGEE